MFITHKYTQTSSLQWTTPNANIVYWNFGVNCLYDPYLSVGGTQPLYFDQLAAIYSHYTVMKSRIKVTMIPNTVEPFVGGICRRRFLACCDRVASVSAATFFRLHFTSAGR